MKKGRDAKPDETGSFHGPTGNRFGRSVGRGSYYLTVRVSYCRLHTVECSVYCVYKEERCKKRYTGTAYGVGIHGIMYTGLRDIYRIGLGYIIGCASHCTLTSRGVYSSQYSVGRRGLSSSSFLGDGVRSRHGSSEREYRIESR